VRDQPQPAGHGESKAKPTVQEATGAQHRCYRNRIAKSPFCFRHVFEIHAIQTSDHRWYGQDRGPRSKAFAVIVLGDGDQ